MSTDFTLVFTAPTQAVNEALNEIGRRLHELGFSGDQDVYKVRFDSERGVFDEINDETFGPISNPDFLKSIVADVAGISIEFTNSDIVLYIVIAQYDLEYVNVFTDITGKTFRRLIRDNKLAAYYAVVGAIALAIRAVGAFGQFEVPFAPVAPEQFPEAIRVVPDMSIPALLGILPMSKWSPAQIEEIAGNTFRVIEWSGGYWVLHNKELRAY